MIIKGFEMACNLRVKIFDFCQVANNVFSGISDFFMLEMSIISFVVTAIRQKKFLKLIFLS